MTIKGIEEVEDRRKAGAILKFIFDKFEDESIVEISYLDDSKYTINDSTYVIVNAYEEIELLKDFNVDYFEEQVFQDIRNPDKWVEFIDREAWIDGYGIGDFTEYWSTVNSEDIEYINDYDDVIFYIVK